MNLFKSILLGTIFFLSCIASSLAWEPQGDIRLIVPFKQGGGTDIGARILEKYAHRYLKHKLKVVNIPGNGGLKGFMELNFAKPDGMTIGYLNFPTFAVFAIHPYNYYKFEDFVFLCTHVVETSIIVVKSDSRFDNIRELVEYARENDGKIRASTNGFKASGHFAAQFLAKSGGFHYDAVHFDGTVDEINALYEDRADFACCTYAEVRKDVDSGKLRVLATFSENRLPYLKNVPTLKENGLYEFWFGGLRGIAAPKGVSDEVVDFYQDLFKKLLNDPDVIVEHKANALDLEYSDGFNLESRAAYNIFFTDYFQKHDFWNDIKRE